MDAPSHAGVSRGTGLAAWRQISDALLADIDRGQLAKGDRIPSELELATRFGVNRHTVRRALAHLQQQGLVRSVQGKGSFVETGRVVQPIADRASPARQRESLPKAGKEIRGDLVFASHAAAPDWVADALDIEAGAHVLELHNSRSYAGRIVSLGCTWLPLPRFVGLDTLFARKASLLKCLHRFGVEDCRRISTRILCESATSDEASTFELPPGDPLLVLITLNTDQSGHAVQLSRCVFPASRVEFVQERG
jgi:GntR family transcriptional regulator, phosphonate transport system regulatory protein